MKKNKKIIIIYLIIFFILGIIINFIFFSNKFNYSDDLIFFKLFGKGQDSQIDYKNFKIASNVNSYIFDVTYNNIDFKNVNILNTVDNKTLVNEKVAPGTEGEFNIILTSNRDTNYEIKFDSKNDKPKNLVFLVEGNKEIYKTLEDMQKILKGNIRKSEQKIITIKWQWNYTNGNEQDIQDTKDGINLSKYNFNIYTIGGVNET